MDQICDGQRHCPYGDDELLCDFNCPQNCNCVGFTADCRDADIKIYSISKMPASTRYLDLSHNNNVSVILEDSYLSMKQLVRLNLSNCRLIHISGIAFRDISNLKSLDLSYNLFKSVRRRVFHSLRHLKHLHLHGCYEIVTIEPGAFEGLLSIERIQLKGTKVKKISAFTFSGLTLSHIDISYNAITEIDDFAFDDLSVEKIDFQNNEITQFNRKVFAGVRNLKELKASAYKFCCIRPTYLLEEDCYPRKDEFSSCEDLMRISALQTMLWLVGISALIGNFFSILYRLVYDRERLKLAYGIFVTNLAAADFLMGIYLIIIAIADAVYRKR